MHLDFFNIIIIDGLEYTTIIINIITHTKKTYCMCVQSSFTFGVYILKQSSIHNSNFTNKLFNRYFEKFER